MKYVTRFGVLQNSPSPEKNIFLHCQKPKQKPLSDFMNPAEESYKGADLNAQIMHRIDG